MRKSETTLNLSILLKDPSLTTPRRRRWRMKWIVALNLSTASW